MFYLSLGNVAGPIDYVVGIDKVYHLIAYGFLSGWFMQISHAGKYAIITAVCLILMGVGLEFLQSMTPHRFFEYYDMIANAVGVLLGWILSFTKLGNVLDLIVRQVEINKDTIKQRK